MVTSDQSSHDGFVCSREGACGLEMLCRRNRDMKEIQRHRIVVGGQLSEYWIPNLPVFNFHMLLYTHTKRCKKAKRLL